MSLSNIHPENQKGLRHIFDINDMQTNPENIDMGTIQPVVDMQFMGFAKLNDYTYLLEAIETGDDLNGLQTKTYRLLSYSNPWGADNQITVPPNHNFLLWGIKVHLYLSAAGAAALAGDTVTFEINMHCPTGAVAQLVKYRGDFPISAAVRHYAPGYLNSEVLTTKNHLQVIPADCFLNFTVWNQTGANFPLLSNIYYQLCGQAFPVGAPVQLGI